MPTTKVHFPSWVRPSTGSSTAAALFDGTSLLIGGRRGQPDREVTTWSNLTLRRRDQIGW
jgi:hypothetical protein